MSGIEDSGRTAFEFFFVEHVEFCGDLNHVDRDSYHVEGSTEEVKQDFKDNCDSEGFDWDAKLEEEDGVTGNSSSRNGRDGKGEETCGKYCHKDPGKGDGDCVVVCHEKTDTEKDCCMTRTGEGGPKRNAKVYKALGYPKFFAAGFHVGGECCGRGCGGECDEEGGKKFFCEEEG